VRYSSKYAERVAAKYPVTLDKRFMHPRAERKEDQANPLETQRPPSGTTTPQGEVCQKTHIMSGPFFRDEVLFLDGRDELFDLGHTGMDLGELGIIFDTGPETVKKI
jgi:hypothetical protein